MNDTTNTEVWKDVEGYKGRYKVSNFGKIKDVKKDRLLKLTPTKKGYLRVRLSDGEKVNKLRVHRVVAVAFLGKHSHDGRNQINHIDCNKSNNHVDNLEWVSHAENIKHAYENELLGNKGFNETKQLYKTTDKDVKVIRYLYNTTTLSYKSIGEIFGLNQSTVRLIVKKEMCNHVKDL